MRTIYCLLSVLLTGVLMAVCDVIPIADSYPSGNELSTSPPFGGIKGGPVLDNQTVQAVELLYFDHSDHPDLAGMLFYAGDLERYMELEGVTFFTAQVLPVHTGHYTLARPPPDETNFSANDTNNIRDGTEV